MLVRMSANMLRKPCGKSAPGPSKWPNSADLTHFEQHKKGADFTTSPRVGKIKGARKNFYRNKNVNPIFLPYLCWKGLGQS